jgi:hypothetical protein
MQMPEFMYAWFDALARPRTILGAPHHPLQRPSQRYRPCFIVGSGRCGTTLLRRMLVAGGEIHIPPETYMLGPAVRFFRRQRDRTWTHLVRNVLAMFEYHREFEHFQVSLRPVYLRLVEAPPAERSLAMVLDAMYRHHAGQTGATCTRWADKTPLNTFAMEEIRATFPDARFVNLIRDGVDVVHSWITADLGMTMEKAAERWTRAIVAAGGFSKRHAGACLDVRYEQLVASPADSLRRVCEFLGLGFHASMLEESPGAAPMGDVEARAHHANALRPVSTASVGKGRRELSLDDRQRLDRLIGRHLERLGYERATK